MVDSQSDLPELTDAQREIMEIVWERNEVSARDVHQILLERREVAKNTVRTLMERMEEKGWLTHREEERTHLYRAARSREASIGQRIVELLDQLCGGSPAAMMSALIDYRGLKAAELKRIQALLSEAKSRKSSSGEKQ